MSVIWGWGGGAYFRRGLLSDFYGITNDTTEKGSAQLTSHTSDTLGFHQDIRK